MKSRDKTPLQFRGRRERNEINHPPAVCPVVNTREIRKGFKEEVAFELDLEGCFGFSHVQITGEDMTGARYGSKKSQRVHDEQ